MRWITTALFAFFAFGSVGGASLGCGDGACGEATGLLCKKACACGDGTDGCKIDANGIGVQFEDEDGCNAFFDFACDNDDGEIDWTKCAAEVASAECKLGAVVSPASCND